MAVRASAWGDWGRELLGPRPGCVLVFTRKGGGHVGLYVGEDRTHFHVLGGNQGNAVNVMRLEKSRLAKGGMRWPYGEPLPAQQRVMLNANGSPEDPGSGAGRVLAQSYDKQADQFESLLFNVALDAEPYQLS